MVVLTIEQGGERATGSQLDGAKDILAFLSCLFYLFLGEVCE